MRARRRLAGISAQVIGHTRWPLGWRHQLGPLRSASAHGLAVALFHRATCLRVWRTLRASALWFALPARWATSCPLGKRAGHRKDVRKAAKRGSAHRDKPGAVASPAGSLHHPDRRARRLMGTVKSNAADLSLILRHESTAFRGSGAARRCVYTMHRLTKLSAQQAKGWQLHSARRGARRPSHLRCS